ncbi:MAG: hypothetical protein ACRC2T_04900, partial [Thermoguttaceae bacterium]
MEGSTVNLREIISGLFSNEIYIREISTLKSGGTVALDGVWGSSCAAIAVAVADELENNGSIRPILLVHPTVDVIDKSADDLALFANSDSKIRTFPFLQQLRFRETENDANRSQNSELSEFEFSKLNSSATYDSASDSSELPAPTPEIDSFGILS